MTKDEIDALIAENDRLERVLHDIEFLTATGDGLNPDETIRVHMLAAEGRAHDPFAWRLDPAVVKLVHETISAALGKEMT